MENSIHLDNITLVAAGACNLQCKYCVISQNESSKTGELFKETMRALDDGTYLKNVLTAVKRLKSQPELIEGFQIWGQEPTMILSHLAPVWKDWVREFPKIKKIFFSTNGMDFIDDIYKFILEVDKCAYEKIEFTIQLSYDGLYGEEQVRGGSREKILNNFLYLNELLNSTELKFCDLKFFIHGVLSFDTLNYIKTDWKKMEDYMFELDDFHYQLKSSLLNRNAEWGGVTIQCQNAGFDTTVENGIDYVTVCKKLESIVYQNKDKFKQADWADSINSLRIESLGAFVSRFPYKIKAQGFKSLDDYIDAYLNKDPKVEEAIMTSYCGAVLTDLKIMYDGTVTTCQNYLFDVYEKNKKKYTNSINDQMTKNALEFKVQNLNYITATDEEIEKQVKWIYDLTYNNSISGMFNGLCNLMFMMAEIGQIDYSYKGNLKKIRRHAFLLALEENCYYNLCMITGSVLMHSIGHARYWCNGILDEVDRYMHEVIVEGKYSDRTVGREL